MIRLSLAFSRMYLPTLYFCDGSNASSYDDRMNDARAPMHNQSIDELLYLQATKQIARPRVGESLVRISNRVPCGSRCNRYRPQCASL